MRLRGVALAMLVLLLALAAAAEIQFARPVPAAQLQVTVPESYKVPGAVPALPWPSQGEAALYLNGEGWLGTSGAATAVPIASATKIMTALVVLRAHPLLPGQAGPEVTLGVNDVDLYRSQLDQGDSVVPVSLGEQLSELQLLEGLLIPSGDNLAQVLATWDAGSEAAFVVAMNQRASALGLGQVHFTDSSGLDPGSSASATDLVLLARTAMANPVFAAIVAQPSVKLPVAGLVRNYNSLLGEDGVVGVKTGWTAAAQGCLVFAAEETVGGQKVEILGAVLGQPGNSETGLSAAAAAARSLLLAVLPELRRVQVVAEAAQVAEAKAPWSKSVSIEAATAISRVALPGTSLRLVASLPGLHLPLGNGAEVGNLEVISPSGDVSSAGLVSTGSMSQPSLWWRLLHG